MSERSMGGALAASFEAIALASGVSAPARNEGLAYETPFSLLQSLAMRPVAAAAIINRKNATIASEIMPTRSCFRRRQASTQRPAESWTETEGGWVRTALIVCLPYLKDTRGSTYLYITSTSRLMIMVSIAR